VIFASDRTRSAMLLEVIARYIEASAAA